MIISCECTCCTHKWFTDSFMAWLTLAGTGYEFKGGKGGSLPYPVGCVARSCLRLDQTLLDSFHFAHRTSLLLTRLISA